MIYMNAGQSLVFKKSLPAIRMGVLTWWAAAMHEIQQELGDFGVLAHGDLTG